MQIDELDMKRKLNGYTHKEEKRFFFAYPSISFVFGIRDGHIFDTNDRGNLHLMSIDLYRQVTLKFFKQFIKHLSGEVFFI